MTNPMDFDFIRRMFGALEFGAITESYYSTLIGRQGLRVM